MSHIDANSTFPGKKRDLSTEDDDELWIPNDTNPVREPELKKGTEEAQISISPGKEMEMTEADSKMKDTNEKHYTSIAPLVKTIETTTMPTPATTEDPNVARIRAKKEKGWFPSVYVLQKAKVFLANINVNFDKNVNVDICFLLLASLVRFGLTAFRFSG